MPRLLLPLCALVPFAWVVWRGPPAGHDYLHEWVRLVSYRAALDDGQLPPYWAGALYAGWGSPIFLFYGQVFLALATACAALLQSLQWGAVLALCLCSLCGAEGMRRLAQAVSPADSQGHGPRVAGYLFVLNPYLLGDALSRNANAEYTALCVMPWALYGVWLCVARESRGPRVLAVALALVIAAHGLSALVAVALIGSFVCARYLGGKADRVAWRDLGVGTVGALLLSAFAWLPVVALRSELRTEDLLHGKFDFHGNFQAMRSLFDNSDFSSSGAPQALSLCAGGYLCLRGRASGVQRRALLWLLVVGAALLCLQLPVSTPVWEHLPMLPYFQFPWRLMGPLALVTALLAGLSFSVLCERVAPHGRWLAELGVLVVALGGAWPALGRMQPLDVAQRAQLAQLTAEALLRTPLSSTVLNEYVPAGVDPQLARIAARATPVLYLGAHDRHVVQRDTPRALVVEVEVREPSFLCLARFRSSLWKLTLDGQPTPRVHGGPGCLAVRVPRGRHVIEAGLPMPAARRVGLVLGLFGLLGLLGGPARAALRAVRVALRSQ